MKSPTPADETQVEEKERDPKNNVNNSIDKLKKKKIKYLLKEMMNLPQ
jgi:hypothetical protein